MQLKNMVDLKTCMAIFHLQLYLYQVSQMCSVSGRGGKISSATSLWIVRITLKHIKVEKVHSVALKRWEKQRSCVKLSSYTFGGGDGDHGICHFLCTLNKKGHNLVTWLSEVLFAKPQGNRYYAGD